MLRKISCLVLLSLLVGLLFCGPALAADHSLARGARVHGFLGLAVIVTIIIHIMTVSD